MGGVTGRELELLPQCDRATGDDGRRPDLSEAVSGRKCAAEMG
jgi:hypothetical protein